jgi:hypothetical protein
MIVIPVALMPVDRVEASTGEVVPTFTTPGVTELREGFGITWEV